MLPKACQQMHFIAHNYFLSKGVVDRSLFFKDLIHTCKKGLRQLALEFIHVVRNGDSSSI